ncbi:MAG: heavy-metal-associated domain-containing protein [Rhodospirillales bacterium]|nr:heavy-metal-associated domain-containing protein [Rhodospirillales bacterium]
MSTIKLSIDGMSCQGCADSLTRRLTEEPGVTKVLVSLENKKADVEYNTEKLTETRLSEVVQEAGFSVQ